MTRRPPVTADDALAALKRDGVTRKQLLQGAGTVATATAVSASPARATQVSRTREYWIAAVPVTWNLVPNGRDAIANQGYESSDTVIRTVVYRAYTPHWRRPLASDHAGAGIDGPLLRAEVGDTLLVHFKNLDTLRRAPHSMHFHGLHYAFNSDGSYIPGYSARGANVRVGESFTYRLEVGRDSVGVWPYHDHSPSMHESIQGGMFGALSLTDPRQPKPDREFIVFFSAMGRFMTINGRAFVGNTPVFRARVGDLVQWDVLTLGDDFHTFHVHGHRWRSPDGTYTDTRTIGPAESFRVRWREDRPGAWLYHCHVESHMMNGMIGLYLVDQR